MRIDRFLAARLPSLSRTRLRALMEAGHLSADAVPITDPSTKVRAGQDYLLEVPPVADPVPAAQYIPLDIHYEDAYLVVVDKPAGLVVHPAPGNPDRTLVNALLAHCGDSLSGIGNARRPGIVHRLDKDTSGLLVVAKTESAHHGLSRLFAAHDIDRAYRALVWGTPMPPAGEISGDIGRSAVDRKKMAVVERGGRTALTRYHVKEAFGGASLVECRLGTGRTHQIRVHMAAKGHPVVGDPLYGGRRGRKVRGVDDEARTALTRFPRQALHAWRLGFRHPVTGAALAFESDLPCDMEALLTCLRRTRGLPQC